METRSYFFGIYLHICFVRIFLHSPEQKLAAAVPKTIYIASTHRRMLGSTKCKNYAAQSSGTLLPVMVTVCVKSMQPCHTVSGIGFLFQHLTYKSSRICNARTLLQEQYANIDNIFKSNRSLVNKTIWCSKQSTTFDYIQVLVTNKSFDKVTG